MPSDEAFFASLRRVDPVGMRIAEHPVARGVIIEFPYRFVCIHWDGTIERDTKI